MAMSQLLDRTTERPRIPKKKTTQENSSDEVRDGEQEPSSQTNSTIASTYKTGTTPGSHPSPCRAPCCSTSPTPSAPSCTQTASPGRLYPAPCTRPCAAAKRERERERGRRRREMFSLLIGLRCLGPMDSWRHRHRESRGAFSCVFVCVWVFWGGWGMSVRAYGPLVCAASMGSRIDVGFAVIASPSVLYAPQFALQLGSNRVWDFVFLPGFARSHANRHAQARTPPA